MKPRSAIRDGLNGRRPMRPGAGFSLIELLVALVLVSAFLVIALPTFFGSSETLKTREAARQIHRILKTARSEAITWAQPTVVAVDTQAQRVALLDSAVAYAVPAGLHLARDGSNGDPLQVTFYPDGTTTGGTFTLAGRRKTLRFTFEPLTGQVTIDAQIHDTLASR